MVFNSGRLGETVQHAAYGFSREAAVRYPCHPPSPVLPRPPLSEVAKEVHRQDREKSGSWGIDRSIRQRVSTRNLPPKKLTFYVHTFCVKSGWAQRYKQSQAATKNGVSDEQLYRSIDGARQLRALVWVHQGGTDYYDFIKVGKTPCRTNEEATPTRRTSVYTV